MNDDGKRAGRAGIRERKREKVFELERQQIWEYSLINACESLESTTHYISSTIEITFLFPFAFL